MFFYLAMAAAAFSPAGTSLETFSNLDPTRWLVSDGYSNGAWFLNDWRRSQLRTGDRGLTIVLDRNLASANGYSSGEIQSRATYKYGYFESRLTATPGPGINTGFFTYTGAPRGRPWNEIDVELLGKNTREAHLTYHKNNQQHETVMHLPFDAAKEAHAFGFDWQPTYVRWYIDGKLVHEETGSQLPLPDQPQQIFIDVWNSNVNPPWMGRFVWEGHALSSNVRCVATAPRFPGRAMC